jgi:hypothetical protein
VRSINNITGEARAGGRRDQRRTPPIAPRTAESSCPSPTPAAENLFGAVWSACYMGAIELPEIDLNLDGRDLFLAARQCVDRSTWIGSGRRHSSVPMQPHWRTSGARPNSPGQISIRQSPRGGQRNWPVRHGMSKDLIQYY